MAKYKVLERSFIGNRIVEVGEVVEYDREPGENLEPVSDEVEVTAPPVVAPIKVRIVTPGASHPVVDAQRAAQQEAERIARTDALVDARLGKSRNPLE